LFVIRSGAIVDRINIRKKHIVAMNHRMLFKQFQIDLEVGMAVLEINDDNFQQEVIETSKTTPVLIDFWAPWCGPCKMIAPLVEELSIDYADKIKCVKLNTDENKALATKFGIMSIPTLMLFRNGEPVERIVGFTQKDNLKKKIDQHV
jgi:thioredoxin 1